MKRKSVKIKFNYAILISLAVALAFVGTTLALYTSQDHQRSVVRNRDNEVIRFSSDKLFRVYPSEDTLKYYYPLNKNERTIQFQVCNYDQAKSTLFNEKNISYTIKFHIKNGLEQKLYTISDGVNSASILNNEELTLSNVLLGGQKSTRNYSITFNEESEFNTLQIEVEVIPDNLSVSQNRVLKGMIIPIDSATTQGKYVNTEFIDKERGNPSQFDAYNLSVTMNGGEGKVQITWNTDLSIDPFFLKKSNVSGTNKNVTIQMDSDDNTASYIIQFYKNSNVEFSSWEDLGIVVTLLE